MSDFSPKQSGEGLGLLQVNLETSEIVFANQRAYQMLGTSKQRLADAPRELLSLLRIESWGGAVGSTLSRTLEADYGEATFVEITVERLDLSEDQQVLIVLRDCASEQKERSDASILGAVLEAAEDMVALIDPNTLRFLQVNQGAVRSLGYSKGELLGFLPMDIKPNVSLSEYRRGYVEPLMRGERRSIQFETIHRRKDGTEFPVEVMLQRVEETEAGCVLLNIARDISQRHRSDLERNRFFSLSLEMLCTADTSGYFLRVNPVFCAVLGYTQEDLVSRPFMDLVHPDDLEATEAAVNHLGSGQHVVGFENRYRRSDGSYRTLRWNSTLDSATNRIYAAAHDVTEERERQQELAEKNRRLEEAASHDRAARRSLVTFNRRKGINEALDEVLRVLAEELKFRPLAFYHLDEWSGTLKLSAGLSLPTDQPVTLEFGVGLIGEAALTQVPILVNLDGEGSEGHSMALETGIGKIYPLAIFAIPLVHQERTLAVLTGASLRVVNEKEWSALQLLADQTAVGLHALGQFEQLRKLSEQLNERGRRIAHQNRELKRASRLKSEFLANMSHELRTPLNAIIGFSECLKDGLLGKLEDHQEDYVTEIFHSGHHLLALINDILDLSKIEAGMMELRLEATDVKSAISNSISIVRELAAKKSLQIESDVDPELGPVLLDARKFRQVIYNLLSNAVKFSKEKGKISITARRENGGLVLSVEDSGIGIAEADQGRLFQPFIQLDGDLDRQYEGTGLGLGLVKGFVTLHGGSIDLWSEVGVGSRFTVRIPDLKDGSGQPPKIASDPNVESSLPPKPSEPRLGLPQILVVDNDHTMRKFLRDCLTPSGYEVVSAADSNEAFEALSEQIPDLIVLDILLEAESGWELLGDLKENPLYKAIPVLVLSGGTLDEEQDVPSGATGRLQKPVTPGQLIQAISRAGVPGGASVSPRVLVVDDDPRAVDYVATVLEAKDCNVHRAYGGQEALDFLARREVDIVILDLMMPGVAGFEVLWNLRSASKNAEVPVVILTAKTVTAEERDILQESVSAILEKSHTDGQDVIRAVGLALREGFKPRTGDGRTQDTAVVAGTRISQPQILLLARDQEAASEASAFFEGTPFQISVAYSAVEVLEQTEFESPDLLALDLVGFDFLEDKMLDLLCDSPQTANIPKVARIPSSLSSLEESRIRSKVQCVFRSGTTERGAFLSELRSILG